MGSLFQVAIIVLAGAVALATGAVAGMGIFRPEPPSLDLPPADAARSAARADSYKIRYRLESGRDTGSVTYTRRGEQISVRLQADRGGELLDVISIESGGGTVACAFDDGAWQCVEGDAEAEAGSGPVFFDPGALQSLAERLALIPKSEMRTYSRQIAGVDSICYDIVPRPGGDLGRDPFRPRDDIFGDLLRAGGTICFGNNLMLRMAALTDPPIVYEAVEITRPDEKDLVPPAPPRKPPPKSPVPTVIQAE